MHDPYKTRKLYDPVAEAPARQQWQPLPTAPIPPAPAQRRRGVGQLVLRGVLLGLMTLAFLGLAGVAGALGVYGYYARQLPSPEELYERTTSFKSTKLFDRHGRLLYEVIDPLGGRRIIVPFGDLPSVLIEATIATEDPTFFTNLGVSPTGIARALYQDLRSGDRAQGGSTITQQLVKNLFLTPERTYKRKVQEAILAAELTRRYGKAEILEVYLNEVYLGNLAYGVGAAAETYFGQSVAQLDLPEAALLVGLIQSPAIYDPYINPEAALARRGQILGLMLRRGYITSVEYDAALQAPMNLQPQEIVMQAPHMVTTVREQLERLYGTEMLYKGGLQVYTTLDLSLQHEAEAAARAGVLTAEGTLASNAALVAIDPRNGEVLALLGSVDFYDATISGQVNMARSPRQPGSTIKPFTYLAALERGWTAGTLIMDLEQSFPDGANPPYKPVNYDDKYWGPVSLRTALANSRNIPAVSTLNQIGLPALLEVCQRLGIRSLTRPDYGLSLTLGGGEVTLLELTAAYGALANGGRRVDPQLILRIEDQAGKLLWERPAPELPQVTDARYAYILTDILADQGARERTFGANSALDLPFAAAAKTGTTNDYRDAWTMGYTPELVTGVWVGNSDNRSLDRLSGARAAAPIWQAFMLQALANTDHRSFARPAGLVEVQVCPISGLRHADLCPPARSELLLSEALPADCTVHRVVTVCQVTGKLATAFCPAESVEQRRVDDYGAAWDDWAHAQGYQTPPRAICDLHNSPSRVTIEPPSAPLEGVVTLRGTIEVADFQSYQVEYGKGHDPQGWKAISPEYQVQVPVYDGVLCQWDTRTLKNGDYTLRVIVRDSRGHSYAARALTSVHNAEPTATASPTPAPTETPTVGPTDTLAPTATATIEATLTARPSVTPSRTPLYTLTPTRTTTPLPSATATAAPSVTPEPTRTAAPTATATPTETVAPTATSTAESYPQPLATPVSTRAAEGYPGV